MDHKHCQNCFSLCCSSLDGCPVVMCLECSVSIHQCKQADHDTICPEAIIPCINTPYGCPFQIKRKCLSNHLMSCSLITSQEIPCNIVLCEFCSQSILSTDQIDHNEVCDQVIIPCTNAPFGCQLKMKRKDLNVHIAHCPASILQCIYTYNRSELVCFGDNVESFNLSSKKEETWLPDEHFMISDNHFSNNFLSKNPKDEPENLYYLPSTITKTSLYKFSHLFNDAQREEMFSMGKRICTKSSKNFPCGNFVRRDEFCSHWRSHVELMEDLHFKISRCPLLTYGCMHAVPLYRPSPKGYTFQYKKWFPSFVICPPQMIQTNEEENSEYESDYAARIAKKRELAFYGYEDDDEGSYDALGQLPIEVLLRIFSYLDSLSLWSISQVNHYLRHVSQEVLTTVGIVYSHWEREKEKHDGRENEDLDNEWNSSLQQSKKVSYDVLCLLSYFLIFL